MDQAKLKVILIGFNQNLLKSIADRVNSQRPVEVQYCTDLKDFLAICLDQQPDLIGVSVSYPHQQITRFPKIFKMALNIPVLTFGEAQDAKTRKALSSTTGDLQIQGVITAHNLWMKIVNFQKMQEEEIEKAQNGVTESGESKPNSIFLKNGKNKSAGNKNSILSSLFSALNEDGSAEKSESNFKHFSSDDGNKPTTTYHDTSSESAELKTSNMNHVVGTTSSKEKKTSSLNSIEGRDTSNNGRDNKSDDKSINTGKRDAAVVNKKASILDSLLNTDPSLGSSKENLTRPESKNAKNKQGDVLDQFPKESESRNNQNQREFGKVQLSDEKEIKEEAVKKTKEKSLREQVKKKSVLELCCELSLEKTFKAPKSEEIKRFNLEDIAVFTVDLGSIKGYLLLASVPGKAVDDEVRSFKKYLIEALKENGAFGDVSEPYRLDLSVENYIPSVAEFSEFNVNHQASNGEMFNVAFVQREVVLPTLSESDKPDMFFIDIKIIPPQTPVNFEAFIYLPRNNRFVRYLKENGSLSLKQAKRHMEEDGQKKLYLPKNQKRQFEKFYIRNTLNWEFELHKKSKAS